MAVLPRDDALARRKVAWVWALSFVPVLLIAVALMHFGIDLTLGLTEFGLAMLAGNLAFVPASWLRGRASTPVDSGRPS